MALIQSVGSLPLLESIKKQAEKLDLVQDILLEVNIGGEEAKSGFAPAAVGGRRQSSSGACPMSSVRGLMTDPPADSDRDTNIRIFSRSPGTLC